MNTLRLPLCLLAAAITAGCAGTSQQYQGNPFDEPVSQVRGQRQSNPETHVRELPVVQQAGVQTQPLTQAQARTEPASVEADVQVFAAGAAPYSVLSTPVVEPESAAQKVTGPGDDVLVEARKVAAAGDVTSQIGLLEQAGYMGNGQAFYELARVYLKGEGVQKDPQAAVGYLTKAVGMDHVESLRVLGWLYMMGTGVSKDIAYGDQLLSKAAETSVRAQREFGQALTNQRVPHLNQMERGLEMLKHAADAGDVEASKAYALAFTPGGAGQVAAGAQGAVEQPAGAAPVGASRQGVKDGGEALKARGLSGDTEALYQYALNVSLGKIPATDPQFTAYCWYAAAAQRGYRLATDEMRSLAGVKTLSDKAAPGRMDSCIADIDRAISGS